MDLLATVRKEGSRGGTADFKWSDVQASSRRENYLGHSLMAPVGRWQKGRDLNWYAKGNEGGDGDGSAAEKAERERKEEIRKIKEAEQDAMARALGYEVAPRNPNMEALGERKDVDKILKESTADEDEAEAKGIGYGGFSGGPGGSKDASHDRLEGNAEGQDAELRGALREYRRRHDHDLSRGHSRSQSRDRYRDELGSGRRDKDRERRHRHRSRSKERRTRDNGGSRTKPRSDNLDRRHRRDRSRSPRRRDHDRLRDDPRLRREKRSDRNDRYDDGR